jgi:PAS domain S-box-containing protein/putative nucleotidyltransferase with HDIG domain
MTTIPTFSESGADLALDHNHRQLFEAFTDGVLVINPSGTVLYANQSVLDALGFSLPELLAMRLYDLCQPEHHAIIREMLATGNGGVKDLWDVSIITRHNHSISAEMRLLTAKWGGENAFFAITHFRTEVGRLLQDERLFTTFMNNLPGGAAFIKDQNGKVLYANKRLSELFGGVDWIGKTIYDVLPKETADEMTADDQKALKEGLQIIVETIHDSDGLYHIFVTYKFPLPRRIGPPMLAGISIDVTDRKEAEEQIQRQLDHLTSLRTIDVAITTRLDLDVTLEIFLEQVQEQLVVDAGLVLVFNPETQTLDYGASKGFHSNLIKKIIVQPDEWIVGRVLEERRMVGNPDATQDNALRQYDLGDEGLAAYYAMPLIAKGEVCGVLIVFHRQPIQPDPAWFEFLESLSSQAAIAIDNAMLYRGLQESNANLLEAYDKTIEGWARALELRDQETEGHSQRLVNMTERLARAMGIPKNDLPQIRQGALLHDIGKMAIPDHILLKPGPLDEEEWEVMKMHTVYARLMLKKIDFLSLAIDIPYAHHEKWDGSGYPQGLVGEQIPLAARVFAVVDVWDALRFDRPYRKGWADEEVLQYIHDQSGKHFDPNVVSIFFKLVKKSSLPG